MGSLLCSGIAAVANRKNAKESRFGYRTPRNVDVLEASVQSFYHGL